MKAITYRGYGSPEILRLAEVEKPVPKDDEVLIRVRAASVNALDRHLLRGGPYLVSLVLGFGRPEVKRTGVDVAGHIEAVGRNVTDLHPGDEVFGVCRGSFAEYACAASTKIVIKSPNISFEQAAAIPVAAMTALQGIRNKGKVHSGQTVLINGAGGGVGTFAVQIAKSLGAEVTAVTRTGKLDTLRRIGADHVVDYTKEDFTKSGQRYDVIFDLGANHPWSDVRRALTDQGRWLFVGGVTDKGLMRPFIELFKGLARSPFMSKKVLLVSARATKDDLLFMQAMVTEGKVTPAIDRTYLLADAVEALSYFERGEAVGKIVITVS
jgi:NADPH:quinone reductase-like Zn-dependent oxidoreductase